MAIEVNQMNTENRFKTMLSVRLMAYMHGEFIINALEGIDSQRTNFDFEVVVGDDFSTDDTLKKIQDFKFTNPRIRVHILDRPRGGAYDIARQEKGRLYNFANIIENCSGKYIALLDGDDFWTDPTKLQKQVNILEEQPHLVGCFHNSEERYWQDYSKASNLFLSFPGAREISIKELTKYNMIPTASAVFRNEGLAELLTHHFLNLPIGDWPLHLLNAKRGNYYYIPQVMSVRILNPNSVWGLNEHKKNVEKVVSAFDSLVKSKWFDNETVDLLVEEGKKLEQSLVPSSDKSSLAKGRSRVVKKMISVLKKYK